MTGPAGNSVLSSRMAGVLLHPTSLPSGNLGKDAYRFVDFLKQGGIRCWQTLPLGQPSYGLSPYQCLSVHGGNVALICLDPLVEAGWLPPLEETQKADVMSAITSAWSGFKQHGGEQRHAEFGRFLRQHTHWLDDYALFIALRSHFNSAPWWDWPPALRDREPAALEQARHDLKEQIAINRFAQFLFFDQWHALRNYANSQGILMFGDTPIFVAENSAEVWAERRYFLLDGNGRPDVVAGVPPDYFSATGQRWGNPLYNWKNMEQDGFSWWIERITTQLELFDILRIDHFRGFEAYWSIPAECQTAIEGAWVKAPGEQLFDTLDKTFDHLPIVVEDLGIITPEVTALRDRYNLPGTKVLQFAFDGTPDNPYLPANLNENSVVYTGTHDNDTSVGWYGSLAAGQRNSVDSAIGSDKMNAAWAMTNCALNTRSQLAIIPMQDLLGLGQEARMNLPGVVNETNWTWQFTWQQIDSDLAPQLKSLIKESGR